MAEVEQLAFNAQAIAALPPDQQRAFVTSLSEEELLHLQYDWPFWARPNQLPPPGDWFIWLIRTGRGWGKTRTGAEWVTHRAKNGPFYPIALVGQTKSDVRDTMIEVGDSSIMKISSPSFMPKYEPSKRRLTWPNGMVATAFSGDEPDQLRGPQHGTVWCDELAKMKFPQLTWDNLEFGLRMGTSPQVLVTTTPRPIPIIKELVNDPDCIDTTGSTYENAANLAPSFIKRVLSKYEGTHLGRQELHGELLTEVEGALWSHALLEAGRLRRAPALDRIVVGVDPPGSKKTECGIVVGGVAYFEAEAHYYIIGDASLLGSPGAWGSAAVREYNRHEADRVVGEVNFGGDMVRRVIQSVSAGHEVAFKEVRASRGKIIRAEPVVALSQQGRLHMVGTYPQLEDELCTFVPHEGLPSPNRMDAMVWTIIELAGGSMGWSARYA